MDVLRDPIGTIKEAFAGVPTKYNNVSRRTLEKFGNEQIRTLQIARTPLTPMLGVLINTISLGKWNELLSKYGSFTCTICDVCSLVEHFDFDSYLVKIIRFV